jgi:hypothetical protein
MGGRRLSHLKYGEGGGGEVLKVGSRHHGDVEVGTGRRDRFPWGTGTHHTKDNICTQALNLASQTPLQ